MSLGGLILLPLELLFASAVVDPLDIETVLLRMERGESVDLVVAEAL
jgi:hypothetical protein